MNYLIYRKMVDVAENLYGKYDWDDMMLLYFHQAFLWGMENPRLTFATPLSSWR